MEENDNTDTFPFIFKLFLMQKIILQSKFQFFFSQIKGAYVISIHLT